MIKGYKTSEFWLMLAAQLVAFLIGAGVFAETSTWGKALAVVASILGAIGYTAARSSVKKADTIAEATKAVSAKKD